MFVITRRPVLRSIFALVHPRYQRMNNRRINRRILAQRKADLAELEACLSRNPQVLSHAGLFDAPFSGR